jgi:hypothetical protein
MAKTLIDETYTVVHAIDRDGRIYQPGDTIKFSLPDTIPGPPSVRRRALEELERHIFDLLERGVLAEPGQAEKMLAKAAQARIDAALVSSTVGAYPNRGLPR